MDLPDCSSLHTSLWALLIPSILGHLK
jgi:hypothetical protein